MRIKENLRQEMSLALRKMQEREKELQSDVISRKLQKYFTSHGDSRKNIAIYKPLITEPKVKQFLSNLGEDICVLTPGTDLQKPYLIDTHGERYAGPIDLFIIPGRAFTLSGDRLGRGGGWYDRLLVNYPDSYKIGVCYASQIIAKLPTESHDIRMHTVISGV